MNAPAETAKAAYDRALAGDLAALDSVDATPAWALCFATVRHLAVGDVAAASIDALARCGDGFDVQLACAERALVAVVERDPGTLERIAVLHERSEGGELYAERARLWCDALGDDPSVQERASAFGKRVAERSLGALRIEAAALGAFGALASGDVEEAVAAARRASRMARSEAIVQHEYLANVVLARVRRRSGRSHLAARILGALDEVAPPAWRSWLDWELGFAGSPKGEHGPARRAIGSAFASARAGDAGAFERALAGLRAHASSPLFARDADELEDALDPRREPRSAASSWCAGAEHQGLAPLEATFGGEGDDYPAFVLAGLGAPRRVLRSGLALARTAAEVPVLDGAQRRDARVLLLLAVLALRGSGNEADVFREVYGFAYARGRHEGVLRVLIHRARALAADRADLDRSAGELRLSPTGPLLVPDPRCAQSIEERVMHYLGRRSAPADSKEIAAALGVSLRAAQRALKQLALDGACVADEQDRIARYRLEDTTFLEPTRSRVVPAS